MGCSEQKLGYIKLPEIQRNLQLMSICTQFSYSTDNKTHIIVF